MISLAFLLDEHIDRRPRQMTQTPLDWGGAFLVCLSTLGVLGGLTLFEQGKTLMGSLGLILGTLSIGALILVEKRAQDPVFAGGLLRNRVIRSGVLSGVFFGGVLYATIAFVPLYQRIVLSAGAVAAGGALVPMSITWTLGSFISGRLLMRLGYRNTVIVGSALAAIGGFSMALIARPGWPEAMLPAALILGAGMGTTLTALTIGAQEQVDWSERGSATSLLQFSRLLGGTLFVSLLGLVMATLVKHDVQHALPNIHNLQSLDDIMRGMNQSTKFSPHAMLFRQAFRDALFVVFLTGGTCGLCAWLTNLGFPRDRQD